MHFLENGGAVALGAVIAALIAVWGVSRTVAQAHEATRAERWWTTYVWVFDHATGGGRRRSLTGRMALEVIERLSNEAYTDLEISLAYGLVDLVRDGRV